QYKVLCPYRLADIPFLSNRTIKSFTDQWEKYNLEGHMQLHCMAAEILIRNTKIMAENGVLHNAITSQNYSLMLELLDFELSRTPVTPYLNQEEDKQFKRLQK